MWRKLLSLKTFIMGEKKKESEEKLLEKVTSTEYKYGFTTDIESEKIQKGLSEDVIKTISKKQNHILFKS